MGLFCFLFPLAQPRKRGRDPRSSPWGRSSVGRLLASEGPVLGPPCRGTSGSSDPARGAAWLGWTRQ
jgi:hypothetical protein